MAHFEKRLYNKFEETPKEIRIKYNCNSASREEVAENNRHCSSSPGNTLLRRKQTSNSEMNEDKSQNIPFQSSERIKTTFDSFRKGK